jgi:hypothetical protein
MCVRCKRIADMDAMCAMLPAGVHWGDPITPEVLRAAIAAQPPNPHFNSGRLEASAQPPAQPVAQFHAHPADWQYNITLLPGVPMLPDKAMLYTAPQPQGEDATLTDEQINALRKEHTSPTQGAQMNSLAFARAVLAAAKGRG